MNIICVCFTEISHAGKRTFSPGSWSENGKIVLDKVLSDERTFAYATDPGDIKDWWLNCKECNWYKSDQTIMSEERFFVILLKDY